MENKIKEISRHVDELKNSQKLDEIVKQKSVIQDEIALLREQNKKLEDELNSEERVELKLITDEEYTSLCHQIESMSATILNAEIEEQIIKYKELNKMIGICKYYMENKKMDLINL